MNSEGKDEAMSITAICLKQFKEVFASVENAEHYAKSYIESPIDQVGTIYDLYRMAPREVAALAKCAAWFVSDNTLLNNTGVPISTTRERIAAYVIGACPWLAKYRK